MEPERPEADELESGPLGHHLRPAGRGTQRCRSRCQRHCCRLARQAGPMRRLMVRSSPLSTPAPDRNINDNSPDISKPASSKTGNNLGGTGGLALKCGNTVNAKTICHFLPEKEILLSTFENIKESRSNLADSGTIGKDSEAGRLLSSCVWPPRSFPKPVNTLW